MKSKGAVPAHRPALVLISSGFLVLVLMLTTVLAAAQSPSEGEATFKRLCASCHSIGGGNLVGPDLKGVTTRREAAWLARWIQEPNAMLAEGDPIATAMLAEFNNIPMPNMGLKEADTAALIAYLQSMDAPPAPAPTRAGEPQASPPTEAPAAAAPPANTTSPVLALNGDPRYGEKIFRGDISPLNGGTSCIACHTVEGVGEIGGGSLGPDLTHVYTRYGREGLAAALGGLPFPTMQGIFAARPLSVSEQVDLLAFFAEADKKGTPRTWLNFQIALGAGTVLAVGLLLGMLIFWPSQRMSIAQRLRKNGRL